MAAKKTIKDKDSPGVYVELAQLVLQMAQDPASDETALKRLMAQASKFNCEEQVKLMDVVQYNLDVAGAVKAKLQTFYDAMRYSITPVAFDKADIQSINVVGVGTAYLSDDVRVSIAKGGSDAASAKLKEKAYQWLEKHKLGDLITETVNSSALASAIKGFIERQQSTKKKEVVPANLFAVTPVTRVNIKRR